MTSSTLFYRKLILWSALAVTVAAALLMEDEAEFSEEEVLLPTSRPANHKRADEQLRAILPIDQLGKRQFNAKADDIFAMTSWEPKLTAQDSPPRSFLPRQPVIQRPPALEPPPLPFVYLGKIRSDEKTIVFLTQGDESYVVTAGTRIDGQYRIDQIRESTIELTYLPLGVRQILTIE